MITSYADQDSKEQIVAGFNHVNRGGQELDVTKFPVVRTVKLELHTPNFITAKGIQQAARDLQ
jgi:hypothetical protein